MLNITHWGQIDAVPDPRIRAFLEDRRRLLTSDYDLETEGGFLIIESLEEDFSFVGTNGLFSDLFDESPPFTDDFVSPFEYACSYPSFGLHEFYLQFNDSKGLVILIPEAVVDPELKRLLDLLLEESP